jgi:L-ascorbate metabolism protein UlaG (beta-lactamase superfamily)
VGHHGRGSLEHLDARFSVMVDGAIAVNRADSSADRIVFLGHATVLIELDGELLLTDPLLRGRVAHLRRQVPPVDRTLVANPAAVLISHLHQDHLDLPSLRHLGRDTPLVVPAGAGQWLGERGFTSVTELSVGEQTSVGALRITAVEARHDGGRRPGGPRGQAMGYLIRGSKTVYFAGDTELFDGMSRIAALAPALDVALLPVGGWGPTLGPGHLDPLDAARALGLLSPRIAVPIHWGTLLPMGFSRRFRARLGDPPRRFAEHAASLTPAVDVRILEPGQETTF